MDKNEMYQDLLRRTGLEDEEILDAYLYGSRVYGNARKDSDYDFIVVTNSKRKLPEQFSDNLINVNIYSYLDHSHRVADCEPSALECVCLPEEYILKSGKATLSHRRLVDEGILKKNLLPLRHSFSAKSSNSWVKAKKKLTVPESYNDVVGKKSLWHAIRIIDFGIQIATHGKIIDYGSCNDFYDEVMYCNDWSEMYEKYKEKHNNILTEFRKLAPKI